MIINGSIFGFSFQLVMLSHPDGSRDNIRKRDFPDRYYLSPETKSRMNAKIRYPYDRDLCHSHLDFVPV